VRGQELFSIFLVFSGCSGQAAILYSLVYKQMHEPDGTPCCYRTKQVREGRVCLYAQAGQVFRGLRTGFVSIVAGFLSVAAVAQ
jgi:hypothetical protein